MEIDEERTKLWRKIFSKKNINAMEYCVEIKDVNIASGDRPWREKSGAKLIYKSADTECDAEGLTIGAYTVQDCKNTTEE